MYDLELNVKKIITKYIKENGHLEPKATEVYDDFKFGIRITYLRQEYKKNNLSEETLEFLNNNGMVWDFYINYFDANISAIKKYKEEYGHINVPSNYKQNDINIGAFIRLVRNRYKKTKGYLNEKQAYQLKCLTDSEIKILTDLGIEWRLDTYSKEIFYINLEKSKEYIKTNGHLRPKKDELFDELLIYSWLQNLRSAYNSDNLLQYKIDEMNELGLIWDTDKYEFYQKYEIVKNYYKEFGDIRVPQRVEIEGIPIGSWLNGLRTSFKKGVIAPWKIAEMNKLGMEWTDLKSVECTSFNEQVIYFYLKNSFSDIENRYRQFKQVNGNFFELDIYIPSLNLAVEYDGYGHHDKLQRDIDKNKRCQELGINLLRIREPSLPKFPDEYMSIKLERENTRCMETSVIKLIDYINKNYGTSLKNNSINKTLIPIDIDIKKDMYSILKLYNMINNSVWTSKFEVCKKYYKKHGNLNIPNDLVVDSVNIKNWLNEQRYRKTGARSFITEERVQLLDSICIDWRPSEKVKEKWVHMFELCKEYKKIYGNINISAFISYKEEKIGVWISKQKVKHNKPTANTGKLSKKQTKELESLGIQWKLKDSQWLEKFNICKLYFLENKNNAIPVNYSIEGFNLWSWFISNRQKYNTKNLTEFQTNKLESLSINLNPGKQKTNTNK